MPKWPQCPYGCGPLTTHHQVWGCPDCNYIWERGNGKEWNSGDEYGEEEYGSGYK